jgi:ribosomal protein S18 acetylase RimI-like enzyme
MAERFVIRTATSADQAFISEMQYEAFFVPPGADPFPASILDEPQIVGYHVGFGTRAGDVGLVAESAAGEPLGAAWVRQVEGYGFVDADTPELGIAVLAGERRRGIGSALLHELFGSVPRCSLSVDTRNPAMRLYQRLGFLTVRTDGAYSATMLLDMREP